MKGRNKISGTSINQKLLWASTIIFGISGILPWFVVNFPIGNLKISILDLMIYFTSEQRVQVDIYSTLVYVILLVGWIFALFFLIGTSVLQKNKLVLVSCLITTIPAIIWFFVIPQLQIQMIFLSLSNQPINVNQTVGSGQITAMISGFILGYSFIRMKI
ncbi:MAG: hypothetical protein R3237_00770 [Nitrosopumilaceae archaeon]|nr:hypothetical protein [Nitrosopumilaceae archaeon]